MVSPRLVMTGHPVGRSPTMPMTFAVHTWSFCDGVRSGVTIGRSSIQPGGRDRGRRRLPRPRRRGSPLPTGSRCTRRSRGRRRRTGRRCPCSCPGSSSRGPLQYRWVGRCRWVWTDHRLRRAVGVGAVRVAVMGAPKVSGERGERRRSRAARRYSGRQTLAVGAFPTPSGRGAGPSLFAEPADLVAALLRSPRCLVDIGCGAFTVARDYDVIALLQFRCHLAGISRRSGRLTQHGSERLLAARARLGGVGDRVAAPW